MKQSIEAKVKATLLEGLKKEGLQWFKPWKAGGENSPINNESGRFYRGFNTWILDCEMRKNNYEYNEWMTFKSCSKRGGKIIKGSKATDVYFWNIGWYDVVTKKSYKTKTEAIQKGADESNLKQFFNLRFYKVFNIGQTEGIDPKRPITETKEVEPIKACEDIIKGYKDCPEIIEAPQDRAFYTPATDKVTMPTKSQFKNVDNFYKTLFHELVHSTGHESRLSRKGVTMHVGALKRTKHDYAFEELVAESGAMMLSGHAGICTDCGDDDTNSQAYINGWVKAVKEANEKAVVSALTQSSKAVDYILGR